MFERKIFKTLAVSLSYLQFCHYLLRLFLELGFTVLQHVLLSGIFFTFRVLQYSLCEFLSSEIVISLFYTTSFASPVFENVYCER